LDTQPSFKILITELTKVLFKNGRGDHAPRASPLPNRLSPKLAQQSGRQSTIGVIYACLAGSGSAFLDFLLNGLRIPSFTLSLDAFCWL